MAVDHETYTEITAENDRLRLEVERLRTALSHYANRDNWTKEPGDQYIGEFDSFDYDGDLADEPWEIAEKALQTKGAGKCDGNHGGPRCDDPECWNDDSLPEQDND